jgi:hypothetical protein
MLHLIMSRKNPVRRTKIKAWKADQPSRAEALLPAPKEMLLDLFRELDERLSRVPCDHSLRFTEAWAGGADVDHDKLLSWLQENGGYCDCEVLMNVPDSCPAFRD